MISSIVKKTLFITGSTKNAGKTTFLNYLLPQVRKTGNTPAYLTIGIDGEQEDMIFGTPKPGIYAEINDYIVTCDTAISTSDGKFEIVNVYPFKTKLGTIVLVKTLRPGAIEIIGPENNSQLNFIINSIRNEHKIETIFIDGAVNRISQITAGADSEFIYIMKVSHKDMIKSINQIKVLSLIKNFPLVNPKEIDEETFFTCEGALTGIKTTKISEDKKNILVNDFTKIFLNWNELNGLLKSKKIYYKEKFNLNFIAVNLYDISRQDFSEILLKNNINEKIVFNPYEYI